MRLISLILLSIFTWPSLAIILGAGGGGSDYGNRVDSSLLNLEKNLRDGRRSSLWLGNHSAIALEGQRHEPFFVSLITIPVDETSTAGFYRNGNDGPWWSTEDRLKKSIHMKAFQRAERELNGVLSPRDLLLDHRLEETPSFHATFTTRVDGDSEAEEKNYAVLHGSYQGTSRALALTPRAGIGLSQEVFKVRLLLNAFERTKSAKIGVMSQTYFEIPATQVRLARSINPSPIILSADQAQQIEHEFETFLEVLFTKTGVPHNWFTASASMDIQLLDQEGRTILEIPLDTKQTRKFLRRAQEEPIGRPIVNKLISLCGRFL